MAGALARADVGVHLGRSGWRFLDSPAFLLAVFALAVLSYGAERSGLNRRALRLATGALGVALGALLFAGALAAGGERAWPGLVAGLACAALAYAAIGALFERARQRLQPSAEGTLSAYADGVALLLAAVAIFVPPVSFVALAAFVYLLVIGRRRADRKYAGLRILR